MSEDKKLNSRVKDVVGEIYNRFTIIENLPSKKAGNSYYKMVKVRCQCGNEKEVSYKAIKKGDIKSCGCLLSELKIDIVKNNTYNHWTILSEVEPYLDLQGNKSRKVLAECVCGKQSEVILNSLRSGTSKSCGCKVEPKTGYQNVDVDSPIPEMTLEQMNQKDFGQWEIIEVISAERNENREIVRTVKAQCKCGHIKIANLNSMRGSKRCSSCGNKDRKSELSDEYRILRKRLTGVYSNIKTRCNNPKSKDYKNYGGRGIKIDESLNTNGKFFDWMVSQGYTYDCKLEIDRKDNDGDYSTENCRLVSKSDNNRNMRRNVMTWELVDKIRYGDYKDLSAKEISNIIGCDASTVRYVISFKTWVK